MIGDKETIIGITSSGDADCKTYGRDMRVDTFLPFLQSYTKAYAAKANVGPQENSGCSMTPHAPGSRSSMVALLALAAAARVRRCRRLVRV